MNRDKRLKSEIQRIKFKVIKFRDITLKEADIRYVCTQHVCALLFFSCLYSILTVIKLYNKRLIIEKTIIY